MTESTNRYDWREPFLDCAFAEFAHKGGIRGPRLALDILRAKSPMEAMRLLLDSYRESRLEKAVGNAPKAESEYLKDYID